MLPVILGIISALKGMQDKNKEQAQTGESAPMAPIAPGSPQTPPVLQAGTAPAQPGQIDPRMQAQIDSLRRPQSPDFSQGGFSGSGGY